MFAFLPVLILLLMPGAWTSAELVSPERALAWQTWLHDRNVPVAHRAAVIAIAIRAARPTAIQPPLLAREQPHILASDSTTTGKQNSRWPGRHDRAGPA